MATNKKALVDPGRGQNLPAIWCTDFRTWQATSFTMELPCTETEFTSGHFDVVAGGDISKESISAVKTSAFARPTRKVEIFRRRQNRFWTAFILSSDFSVRYISFAFLSCHISNQAFRLPFSMLTLIPAILQNGILLRTSDDVKISGGPRKDE